MLLNLKPKLAGKVCNIYLIVLILFFFLIFSYFLVSPTAEKKLKADELAAQKLQQDELHHVELDEEFARSLALEHGSEVWIFIIVIFFFFVQKSIIFSDTPQHVYLDDQDIAKSFSNTRNSEKQRREDERLARLLQVCIFFILFVNAFNIF